MTPGCPGARGGDRPSRHGTDERRLPENARSGSFPRRVPSGEGGDPGAVRSGQESSASTASESLADDAHAGRMAGSDGGTPFQMRTSGHRSAPLGQDTVPPSILTFANVSGLSRIESKTGPISNGPTSRSIVDPSVRRSLRRYPGNGSTSAIRSSTIDSLTRVAESEQGSYQTGRDPSPPVAPRGGRRPTPTPARALGAAGCPATPQASRSRRAPRARSIRRGSAAAHGRKVHLDHDAEGSADFRHTARPRRWPSRFNRPALPSIDAHFAWFAPLLPPRWMRAHQAHGPPSGHREAPVPDMFPRAADLGGTVLFAPLRLRIRPGKFREPDLVVLCDAGDPRRGNDLSPATAGPFRVPGRLFAGRGERVRRDLTREPNPRHASGRGAVGPALSRTRFSLDREFHS